MTNAEVFLKDIENSDVYNKYLGLKTVNLEHKPVSGIISLEGNDEYLVVEKKVRDLFTNSNLGLTFIDSGCYRTVFSRSDLVAKITYNEDGSNERELSLIRYLRKYKLEHLLKYLCPVLASSDNILITPLCKSLYTSGNFDLDLKLLTSVEFSSKSQRILSEFRRENINFKDILGLHQWGIYNNNLVILDYADWSY